MHDINTGPEITFFMGQVENSDVSDISDFSDQIV